MISDKKLYINYMETFNRHAKRGNDDAVMPLKLDFLEFKYPDRFAGYKTAFFLNSYNQIRIEEHFYKYSYRIQGLNLKRKRLDYIRRNEYNKTRSKIRNLNFSHSI